MSKSIERMVLERALELMRTRWVKFHWAVDAKRHPVAWHSKKAKRFCAESAIRYAARELIGTGSHRLAQKTLRELPWLMPVNDDQGRKPVMALVVRVWSNCRRVGMLKLKRMRHPHRRAFTLVTLVRR